LSDHIANVIGTIARPAEVRFADVLPKTRSGKIMRRLLRELAHKGGITGDTTTLEDLSVIAHLAQQKSDDEV
jgi:acetyl-CoA synthetase